jgi:DnaK suppressor protein
VTARRDTAPSSKSRVKKSASSKAATVKKPVSKKTSKKTPAAKKVAKKVVKKALNKTSAQKTTTKPKPKKTSAPKAPVTKKTAAKKSVAKKTGTKKPVAAAAGSGKKPASKKTVAKNPKSTKSTSSNPTSQKKAAKPDTSAVSTPAPAASDDKASNRKGITIVKPTAKKTGGRSRNTPKFVMPDRPQLLGPGSAFGSKPLIPSGPSAPKVTSVFDEPKSKRTKSPLSKAKLEKYRLLLIAKRAELLGDVTNMENEALRSGGSGGLSNTPQHAAEQGSENYDQSLSLNLAAQDRRLIKDIDDALARIESGTFGLCELTGHPIPEDRLNELPWARYTIEAARELERRGSPT